MANPRCHGHLLRTKKPCKNYAMNGKKVCRLHGGLTPIGPAHGAFKHGRYSKFLPARFLARYEEALADDTLVELRDEIAILDLRLAQLVEKACRGGGREIWQEWADLSEQRRKHAESERKRLVEMQQTMTLQQGQALLAAVLDSVRRNIADRKALGAISADIARLVAGTAGNAAQ